jgi:translation elongation factor EF-G
MTTILIKPKSKAEENLLTRLFRKMNIEVQLLEEPMPYYETSKAMEDVQNRKGTKLNNPDQLFDSDWEKLSKNQKQGIIDAVDEIEEGKGLPDKVVMDKFRKKYTHA